MIQKTIITLLCSIGLAISFPSAAKITVREDAPTRYVVQKGDTLWGISKRYLNHPWHWPELWGYNKAQIKNPHRIYPGQVLVLHYVNGIPRLSMEGDPPVIKLSPGVQDVTAGYGIPTLPIGMLRNFMDYPKIISKEETMKAPRLVSGGDRHLVYSPGDRVYATGITHPGRYLSYRISQDIHDPETHQYLGQEVVYSGEVATIKSMKGGPKVVPEDSDRPYLKEGERYTDIHPLVRVPTIVAQPMTVLKASSEIQEGDYLRYVPENSHDRFNFIPHAPSSEVRAKIIRIFDGVHEAGRLQTIVLNKGEKDGIDRGTVLNLYRRDQLSYVDNKDVISKTTRGTFKYISIPAEDIGIAMVYEASDNLAYAIIINSTVSVGIGDIATNPYEDLEDMPIPKEHVSGSNH